MAAAPNLAIVPVAADVPSPALILYSIDDQLACLVETLDAVPAEQEPELLAEISKAINTVEGRDKMGRLLAHIESQQQFAAAELKRLQERKGMYERVLDKCESLLIQGISALGRDAKGKWLKLAGNLFTFSVAGKAAGVLVDDEPKVPVQYRRATVTLPAALWEEVIDQLPIELSDRVLNEAKRKDEVQKSLIEEAIDQKIDVPGARLDPNPLRLVRK